MSKQKLNANDLRCTTCSKYFSRPYNLKLHLKKLHPKIYAELNLPQTTRYDQKCPLCDYSSNVRSSIEKHLRLSHNIAEVSDCKVLYFDTKNEFLEWKSNVERSTETAFIQPCGALVTKDVKTTYYYCNRSGYFIPKGAGKRAARVKGSLKINGICPAKIKLIERPSEGIEVHFTDIHLGHDNELHDKYIRKEERKEIASKISQNVPLERILDELREIAEMDSSRQRLKFITKKDLRNIKYSRTLSEVSALISNSTDTETDDYCLDFESEDNELFQNDISVLDNYITEYDISEMKRETKNEFVGVLNAATTLEQMKMIKNSVNNMKELLRASSDQPL